MDKIPTARPPIDGEGGGDRDSRTILAFLAAEMIPLKGEGERLRAIRPTDTIGYAGLRLVLRGNPRVN